MISKVILGMLGISRIIALGFTIDSKAQGISVNRKSSTVNIELG